MTRTEGKVVKVSNVCSNVCHRILCHAAV